MRSIVISAAAIAIASNLAMSSPNSRVERRTPVTPRVGAHAGWISAIPAGLVEQFALKSRNYDYDRRIWVYAPPGYSKSKVGGYPLIVIFDGRQHLGYPEPVPAMLDSLTAAGKIPAFVGVFVDDSISAARIAELGNSSRFASFVGSELIPWVRAHFNVTSDPHFTITAGSSAGGLAAAYVAFRRPDLFGNVLSQSGAFWRGNEASNDPPYEWLASQYSASRNLGIRFLIDIGSLESMHVLGGAGPTPIDANRRFRDVLLKKGYRVSYTEVPGGAHSPESWKSRFAQDLVTLVSGWSGLRTSHRRTVALLRNSTY